MAKRGRLMEKVKNRSDEMFVGKATLMILAIFLLSVGVAAQTPSATDRKPVQPIRPYVVMTGQSLSDLNQKLQPSNKVEELIGGAGMELRVAVQHEKGTAAANGEVHDASDDVYYVLDGSAELTLGGTLE